MSFFTESFLCFVFSSVVLVWCSKLVSPKSEVKQDNTVFVGLALFCSFWCFLLLGDILVAQQLIECASLSFNTEVNPQAVAAPLVWVMSNTA